MDQIEAEWEKRRAARRMAFVIMTKPFKEIDKKVKEDRDFALAVTDVLECSISNIEFYKGLVELFAEFDEWAAISLAGREDMTEILTEVRAT